MNKTARGYPAVTPYFSKKYGYYEDHEGLYLHDDRVKPKHLLHVTHIAGRFINCATTEYIVVGYWNGAEYVELYNGVPNAPSGWVHWNGDVWLREGQFVYMYAADLAAGERKELHVIGRYE